MTTREVAERIRAARETALAALDPASSGAVVAETLTAAVEDVVVALCTRHLAGAPPGIAVLATGGFGRRELAPYSDLDLLVLCEHTPDAEVQTLAEAILYPLWDAKVDAGHAVRSLEEALALTVDDLPAATALLDARPLAGDRGLAERFLRQFEGRVHAGAVEDFVPRLRAEHRARHGRFGDTLFLLEPDLKSGPGGIRDLCALRWAAQARTGSREPGAWAAAGLLPERQAVALLDARDALLKIRAAAHVASGRRQDHLRFTVQEAIAPRLYPDAESSLGDGPVQPAVAPAVEALMHRFQRSAKLVRRATEQVLERAATRPRPSPRARVALGPGAGTLDLSFVLQGGALEVADAEIFDQQPSEMLRLFSAAIELDVGIASRTRDLVAERAATAGAALRADPTSGRRFLDVLADPRDRRSPSRLEDMHDLGLLSALLPEWEPCAGRVQHDIYHVYTVDQHTLYAVAQLKALARGDLGPEHPLATAEHRLLTRPRALALGTLLHDIGKPLGQDHSGKGARLCVDIATRLGFDGEDTRRAEALVRLHLVMAQLSQRRDLEDLSMIADFGRQVGDEEGLRGLYLLTFCDLGAVAPGNLNSWKETLLDELFQRTLAYLRRGPDLLGAERAELVRKRKRLCARELGEVPPGAELAGILGGLPDRYFVEQSAKRIAAHVRLLRGRQGACAVEWRPRRRLGHSEMVLAADDAPGLLSEVTGVLLAHRIDVVDAAIYSRRRVEGGAAGEALDVFRVRDGRGRALTQASLRQAIETDLEAVLGRHIAVDALLAARRPGAAVARPRVTPEIPTEVKVDNDASRDFTLVEVVTQDRPGVLHGIARTLFAQGLDIHRSKVATWAGRVADVFYVRDGKTGEKITDAARLHALRAALLAGLPGC